LGSLHGAYEVYRINHSECYSDGIACTNMAESFFSRLRRMEVGTHHHIAGPRVMRMRLRGARITAASPMAIRLQWWRVRH
jgi:hypothetical protein